MASLAVWAGILPAQTAESFVEGASVTLEVGYFSAGDAGDWMRQQILRFEETHPRIRVLARGIAEPYRDEVRLEHIPDLPLNVIGLSSDMGYEPRYLADRDLIVPIEDFLPDPDFQPEEFFEKAWGSVTYQGKRWGVPYLCDPMLFVLDWPLFEEAKIASPPGTWEEVLAYSRRLTQYSGEQATQWGFRFGMRGDYDTYFFYLWVSMVLQKGGFLMTEGRFDLSHPALIEAYRYLEDLLHSGGATIDNRKFPRLWGDPTVRYAMQIVPLYHILPLKTDHRYRIVPWPSFEGQALADELTLSLAVRKSSPEKEAASWQLVKWIARPDADYPNDSFSLHFSCRKNLMDRLDMKAKIAGWAPGFDQAQPTKAWSTFHGDQVPGRYEALRHLESLVHRSLMGEIPLEEVLARGERECNAILASRSDDPQPLTVSEVRAAAFEAGEPLLRVRKAVDSYDTGDFNQAARGLLLFRKESPDLFRSMDLFPKLLDSLKNDGHHLGAAIIIQIASPEALLDDLIEFLAIPQEIVESRAVEWAACLFKARFLQDSEATSTAIEAWATAVRAESNELSATDPGLPLWVASGLAVIRVLAQEPPKGASGSLAETLSRCSQQVFEKAVDRALTTPDFLPIALAAFATRLETLHPPGNAGQNEEAYRFLLSAFPDNPAVAPLAIDLADFYRLEQGDLPRALETLQVLMARNPDSPEAEKAALREARWLFEAKQYDQASACYDHLLARGLNPGDSAFYRALCDQGKGDLEGSRERMRRVVRDFPGTPASWDALVWLAQDRVAEFDFQGARQLLDELSRATPRGDTRGQIDRLINRMSDPFPPLVGENRQP